MRCSKNASSLSILSNDLEGYFADVNSEHSTQTQVWLLFKLAFSLIEHFFSAKVVVIFVDCFELFLLRLFFDWLRSHRFLSRCKNFRYAKTTWVASKFVNCRNEEALRSTLCKQLRCLLTFETEGYFLGGVTSICLWLIRNLGAKCFLSYLFIRNFFLGLFYGICFFHINLLVLLLLNNLLQIILLWQVFLISVFLRAFWRARLTFRVITGLQLHIRIDFPEFLHSLASLVPPPLVNLGLCHACLFWNCNDFLSRPKQIAASKLILEASQLLFCLALASVAATLPLRPNNWVFIVLWDFSHPNFFLSVWRFRVCEGACCWGQCSFVSCAFLRRLARVAVWLLVDHWLLSHHRQGLRGRHATLLLCSRCPAHFLSLLGRAAPPNCALRHWFALAWPWLVAFFIISLNIGHCGGGRWSCTWVFLQVCWFGLRRFWYSVTTVLGLPLSYTDEGLEATDEAPWGAIIEYTGPGLLGFISCWIMKHLKEVGQLVNGLESRLDSMLYRRRWISN